jgi:hypothetical protein
MRYVVRKDYAAHSPEEPRELWKEILFCGALEVWPKTAETENTNSDTGNVILFQRLRGKMRAWRLQHVALELQVGRPGLLDIHIL